MVKVQFRKLLNNVQLPFYATPGASGFDIIANHIESIYVGNRSLETVVGDTVMLEAGERCLVCTGFSVAIPEGYELQIRSRSGNALKKGLVVLNSPGTIDSDYRGEVKVILLNASDDQIIIKAGDKIAQGVVAPYVKAEFEIAEELPETLRGEGGFGSTDVNSEGRV